ncbi:MAG TPA: choice-of-anchor tandem repeat GloVer-containing protein [Candidatus Binatia bacterium]|nr:choice-of-anchor tandem repeat GloVer-containing protein [Candidatus Binatia bacterium]
MNGDGGHPQAGLVVGGDGHLYGTTAHGGTNGWGTIFTLNHDGSGFSLLRLIPGTNSNEIEPLAGLLEGSDGALYGTTWGLGGIGTIFALAHDGGAFTNLYRFNAAAGVRARLIEGTNGALFGTASIGTAPSFGTVFKLNKDGSGFSTLRTFGSASDGRNPAAGLVQGASGLLYGTTLNGSTNSSTTGTNWGTVFKIATDGTAYKILRSFDSPAGDAYPAASLIPASDGALYGTASSGGTMTAGTLFALGLPPVFTGLDFGAAGALLHLSGISGRNYAIQSTTNLFHASWQLLPGLAGGTNGLFQFLASGATNSPATFYRALAQ